MKNTESPLSPHLTVYRWPVTMTLSILHRATGVALSVGLIVFVAWLYQAAAGADAYQSIYSPLSTLVGRLLLLGWSFAFFLHLGNGIRHLVWDTGRGLGKRQADQSAWFVIILAFVLTAGFWAIVS